MRSLMNLLFVVVMAVSFEGVFGATAQQNAAVQQQGGEQNGSSGQQQPQTSSGAAVRSETGCLVRSDSGYSLRTDTDTFPIETDKDLSPYVNKKIKVTGIVEHHNASSSKPNGPIAISDIRLRLVTSVIGDCALAAK